MQWGDKGWHKELAPEEINKELDWEIAKDLILKTCKTAPFYLLWGGEPFLYSRFYELLRLLKEKKCFASVCTNGFFLSKFKDAITDNPYISVIVSLDGFKEETDSLRGKGVYDRVMNEINIIKQSAKKMPFFGIEYTVMPDNVKDMHAFCKEARKLDIDWIVFNLCWFISKEQAHEYENFMEQHFNLKARSHLGYLFEYDLNKERFISEFKKIKNETWPFQVSWQPPITDYNSIYTYIDKPRDAFAGKSCYKQWLRADIMPDGKVVACKEFPDFVIGDLKQEDIFEIWNSKNYRKFREVIRKEMLPVCSKCDGLGWYTKNREF